MFYHPGIPRGIYRVLQWIFTMMFAVYMKSTVRFIFLGRLLGALGRCVWGSLWCWRCLCEIAEPRVGGEIWGPSGGLLTISCIPAAGGGPFVRSLLDSCSMERSSKIWDEIYVKSENASHTKLYIPTIFHRLSLTLWPSSWDAQGRRFVF